jgi:hypothetical protein
MMIGPKLEELLRRARGPMGPTIELDFGLTEGPLVELGELLTRMNGFFVFNGGAQVFHAGEQGLGPDLLAWNEAGTWKDTYGGLADDYFCFGQDIFGVQFAIKDNAEVVTFDPETARDKHVGNTLDEWASWLLEDPDVRGAASFAKAYQDANGPLQPDQRLVPLQFFVGGGGYDFDNFAVRDAVTAMRIRGPIAQQVHRLPEGATIKFSAS